jgi:hypothetical protein
MYGDPKSFDPPTLTQTWYDSTAYQPPWVYTAELREGGDSNVPRFSVIGEIESNCPKPWPAQYQWRLMGIGAMPRFQLGYTTPTFNNQMAPMSVGYNTLMPGLNRTPFGGN